MYINTSYLQAIVFSDSYHSCKMKRVQLKKSSIIFKTHTVLYEMIK